MTIIASLLFLTALGASIGVIVLTIRNAMPRIHAVIDMEFAPSVQRDRQSFLAKCGAWLRQQLLLFRPHPVCKANRV